MLTREMMGIALLGISWMTAFMVALDALIDFRAMRALLKSWKTTLRTATVKTEELASHEVEQRVKELDSESPGLVFFDRKHTSLIKGGVVSLDGKDVTVSSASSAEVWVDADTKAKNATCNTTAQFDALMQRAKGAGGGTRVVKSTVHAGQTVWLAGEQQGETFVASLISTFDPREFARARAWASLGVVFASTAWVIAGSVLAFWPPVFGMISIGGAVVLIAHFLGMTPLAMAAREKSRLPSVAFLRGSWRRDEVRQESAVASPVTAQN
ncbi:MAG: hypothetical protein QM817_29975 [Archangium sp.]